MIKVIVNGLDVTVPNGFATYEELVALSKEDGKYRPEKGHHSICYTKGPEGSREGTVLPKGFTVLEEGMVFDITDTSSKA